MLLVPLGQGPDAERRKEPLLVEHPLQNAMQLRLVTDAEQITTFRAAQSRRVSVVQHVAVTSQELIYIFEKPREACVYVRRQNHCGAERQQPNH
jgi:hypothetical protein